MGELSVCRHKMTWCHGRRNNSLAVSLQHCAHLSHCSLAAQTLEQYSCCQETAVFKQVHE